MTACSKYTNVGTGDIQTTIGGNLQCNYVIHAVCCDWNSSGEAEKVSKVFTLKDGYTNREIRAKITVKEKHVAVTG
jgi:hypothetical protein